jgi:hypothetical protein
MFLFSSLSKKPVPQKANSREIWSRARILHDARMIPIREGWKVSSWNTSNPNTIKGQYLAALHSRNHPFVRVVPCENLETFRPPSREPWKISRGDKATTNRTIALGAPSIRKESIETGHVQHEGKDKGAIFQSIHHRVKHTVRSARLGGHARGDKSVQNHLTFALAFMPSLHMIISPRKHCYLNK